MGQKLAKGQEYQFRVVAINKAGKFDVPIFGEPAPEVCWMKGEEPIDEDRSISIMNTDSHAKLVFNSITPKNAGTYTLVITNKSGEDHASVHVSVLDRPAAPEGPMKVSVEGSAITLLWKKVKDDGGVAIEHYQLEKIDNEKNSWGACGHTQDNQYTLTGFPGLTYQFRVSAVNRIGDSDPLTSEPISVTEGADALVRSL